MCYLFPADWTLDSQGHPTNRVLSATDKAFIGKEYHFRTQEAGKFRI